MPMPKKRTNRAPIATLASTSHTWWLADGDEECPHCGGLYLYELEVRCNECDGPTCPHCHVTHSEGYLICPDCHADSSTENLPHG